MKKFKNFIKKHTWILILLVSLLFIPQSFNYQAKLNMRVLVSGLAIDKTDVGYEVTAQVIMPTAGSEGGGQGARLDFISEKGESIGEGIQKIAYKIGKTAGLSHTSFVMVGEDMLKENLASALDYFARDAKVNPSLMLVVCSGKAKDMIQETKNLELSVAVGLQKVFIYKQSSLNAMVIPLEEFINDSFGLAKSAMVGGILIAPEGEEELTEGVNGSEEKQTSQSQETGGASGLSQQSSSKGDAGSTEKQSSNQEKKARIKFFNDIYYFKEGKYVNKLDSEKEILGAYLTEKHATSGDLKISGVSGGILEDATIGLTFTNKNTGISIKFKKGNPILVYNIKIRDVQITEVLNKDKPTVNLYNKQDEEMLQLIEEKLKEEIELCIRSAFEKAQKDGVDIFNVGERAYQLKYKEWIKYYEEHGENYLKNADIEVNVDIRNIN